MSAESKNTFKDRLSDFKPATPLEQDLLTSLSSVTDRFNLQKFSDEHSVSFSFVQRRVSDLLKPNRLSDFIWVKTQGFVLKDLGELTPLFDPYLNGVMSTEDIYSTYSVSQTQFLKLLKLFIPEDRIKATQHLRNALKHKKTLETTQGNQPGTSKESLEKRRKTSLARYGTPNPASSKEVRDKINATCISKYGTTCSANSNPAREKALKKLQEKYGDSYSHPMQVPSVLEKAQKTLQAKYGEDVQNPSQIDFVKSKKKEKSLSVYGVECPLQADIVREKSRDTLMERYGVDHQMKSSAIADKVKETCLQNHGIPYGILTEASRERAKSASLEKYGSEYFLASEEYRSRRLKESFCLRESRLNLILSNLSSSGYEYQGSPEDFSRLFLNEKPLHEIQIPVKHSCGHVFDTHFFKGTLSQFLSCPLCIHKKHRSNREEYFKSLLESSGITVYANNTSIIPPYELDLFLPKYSLAIEFNGSYWHSSSSPHATNYKEPSYHKHKSDLCQAKGIQLYHFWDYDSDEFILNILSKALSVDLAQATPTTLYARKLHLHVASKSDTPVLEDFFDRYHKQGKHPLAKGICYLSLSETPATFETFDDIISTVSFKYSKISGELVLENSRFCVKPFVNVVGGFQKLLKTVISISQSINPSVTTLVTYCDRDISPNPNNTVYSRNNFRLIGNSGPELFYCAQHNIKNPSTGEILFYEGQRISRRTLQKPKLKTLFSLSDADLENQTEVSLLHSLGILACYNSGNWKYSLDIGTPSTDRTSNQTKKT